MARIKREIQSKIRAKAKEEKGKGNEVKIAFQKLIINKEEWT